MPIPDNYVTRGLKAAEGITVFGVPISLLTEKELLACLANTLLKGKAEFEERKCMRQAKVLSDFGG